MAKLGDLLVEAFQNDTPDMDKLRSIRLALNKMQGTTSTLDAWMQPGGNVDANIFAQNSSGFSILPHECGSLHGVPAGGITVPDTTWTLLTANADSGATWSRGLKIDPANGRIYTTGIARETVVLIAGYVTWEGDMSGDRVDIKWNADDSSAVNYSTTIPATYATNYTQTFVHIRSLPSTETYYYMQAAQYTGGSQTVVDLNFVVARLR